MKDNREIFEKNNEPDDSEMFTPPEAPEYFDDESYEEEFEEAEEEEETPDVPAARSQRERFAGVEKEESITGISEFDSFLRGVDDIDNYAILATHKTTGDKKRFKASDFVLENDLEFLEEGEIIFRIYDTRNWRQIVQKKVTKESVANHPALSGRISNEVDAYEIAYGKLEKENARLRSQVDKLMDNQHTQTMKLFDLKTGDFTAVSQMREAHEFFRDMLPREKRNNFSLDGFFGLLKEAAPHIKEIMGAKFGDNGGGGFPAPSNGRMFNE